MMPKTKTTKKCYDVPCKWYKTWKKNQKTFEDCTCPYDDPEIEITYLHCSTGCDGYTPVKKGDDSCPACPVCGQEMTHDPKLDQGGDEAEELMCEDCVNDYTEVK
jgi:hypothetical protein